MSAYDKLEDWISKQNPGQDEYLQAIREIARDVIDVYEANESYKKYDVLRRLCMPERIIHFTVTWLNDNQEVEINQGWRVQHSGLIGPYKGGLRFHPTVNESILKFLAFEQCFKNALTGMPIGGAKGGADFDPRGRSEAEVMRFCQAFMIELQHHIGPNTDVPAGDINVGAREIGFLYGEYRGIHNLFSGTLTGKGLSFGGSHVRTEATGFGLIYMLRAVLAHQGKKINGLVLGVSGAGNVAMHAALKGIQLGAKVISLSNSRGCLEYPEGFREQDIEWAIDNKPDHKNVLTALQDKIGGTWHDNKTPWHLKMDVALPCATQNELDETDAKALMQNGVNYVLEGANMPCTDEARQRFEDNQIVYVPGKAANAGGVAISGLEMSQNAGFQRDSFDQIDESLQQIMQTIHDQMIEDGTKDGKVNYARGANIAGFRRLADAMVAQGI
ncbi:NADP-specific glutamate dehydrogenase [Alteromonas lipotrueiana]|uniref:NADP-specific glutamate dehydrogenase n=1 Tax=Alteromonas lipotrueiana TaxID=2803815 RepID=UPI001C46EBD5